MMIDPSRRRTTPDLAPPEEAPLERLTLLMPGNLPDESLVNFTNSAVRITASNARQGEAELWTHVELARPLRKSAPLWEWDLAATPAEDAWGLSLVQLVIGPENRPQFIAILYQPGRPFVCAHPMGCVAVQGRKHSVFPTHTADKAIVFIPA
jgi:hypothetical protein